MRCKLSCVGTEAENHGTMTGNDLTMENGQENIHSGFRICLKYCGSIKTEIYMTGENINGK